MARTILHLDLDAFYCMVEIQLNPKLKGKAFAVGGSPDQRGVVASCSYEARQYGVRSAMPMAQAVRRCPGLLTVHANFHAYRSASTKVMARLNNLTPFVEQISIDEAFLDVTGLHDPDLVIAQKLQATINTELGLPCSLGVASNKLVAKIANNIGKAQADASASPTRTPNAITHIPAGDEAVFLAPLPIRELWGVGPKTAQQLHVMGIETIGDLAQWPEQDLTRRFGKLGGDLSLRARGIDSRPVETEHEAKSISKETTFARDVGDLERLRLTILSLSEGVGRQLRKSELSGTTVKLKLRWSDFTTITRQTTLRAAVDQDSEIYEAAMLLFNEVWSRGRPVRLIGVGVTGLQDSVRQLELWETEESKRQRQFQSVLDDLRDKFGDEAVQRGSDLKPPKGSH